MTQSDRIRAQGEHVAQAVATTFAGRARDRQLEERIAGLAKRVEALAKEHRYAEARTLGLELSAAIAQRSPEQVARMERDRGLQR